MLQRLNQELGLYIYWRLFTKNKFVVTEAKKHWSELLVFVSQQRLCLQLDFTLSSIINNCCLEVSDCSMSLPGEEIGAEKLI